MNEPYRSFNAFLKEKFPNQKVRKIPINAGFSCPNKDGTKSRQGCIFCDAFGSGPIKGFRLSIREQIERFIQSHPGCKYIAYYQAHSNTYAPVGELKKKYEIIFEYPGIVGLFIGTRPDAVAAEAYPLLEELNQRTYLSVELGLQSCREESLEYLNRSHSYGQFLDTFHRLKERSIDVVVHLIVGIPGESKEQMLQTVQEMNRIKPAGIKFHLLHVLAGTALCDQYKRKRFKLLEMEEYCDLVKSLLEHLDPDIVIHRLTGEREREIFVAPAWALHKTAVINRIKEKMRQQGSFQGKFFTKPAATTYYLGLGTNLGERRLNLEKAIAFLRGVGNVDQVSSLYETQAVDMAPGAGTFYNLVLRMNSELAPQQLLDKIKAFEKSMGRDIEKSHMQPRAIDIDILLADDSIINQKDLAIPHPQMHNRAFVLIPLAEIAPNLRHPVIKKPIKEIFDNLETHPMVKKVGKL